MDILLYNIDDEIRPLLFDISRLITMQTVTQLLVSMNNSNKPFFTIEFLQVTLFLILSLMVFWMVVYKYFNKNKYFDNIIEKYKNKMY
tara:strand:+ start:677 stop:940 length:264 start_codon:yes stop_codon:yes gene_type:complete